MEPKKSGDRRGEVPLVQASGKEKIKGKMSLSVQRFNHHQLVRVLKYPDSHVCRAGRCNDQPSAAVGTLTAVRGRGKAYIFKLLLR